MSVPGVDAITSLAYVTTIEDLTRFGRSRAVGLFDERTVLRMRPSQSEPGLLEKSFRGEAGQGLDGIAPKKGWLRRFHST